MLDEELHAVRQKLLDEGKHRKTIENELVKLKNYAPDSDNDFEVSWPISYHLLLKLSHLKRLMHKKDSVECLDCPLLHFAGQEIVCEGKHK